MKRILLDTNVYEFILKYIKREELVDIIVKRIIIVYGVDTIRKELREIPKYIQGDVNGKLKSLRNVLLTIYDATVGKHHYKTTLQMEEIAKKYHIVYKNLGGFTSQKEILNDFIIVACATLNNLDVVVSEDAKTMLSSYALKSYNVVNDLSGFRTPQFIKFNDFKNRLRGGRFD